MVCKCQLIYSGRVKIVERAGEKHRFGSQSSAEDFEGVQLTVRSEI